jgi:hypothetical protein
MSCVDDADLIRLANVTKLRIALQILEAVRVDRFLRSEDLAEVIERIGEMVRECER